jgi:Tfp pilus assembly protein PilO
LVKIVWKKSLIYTVAITLVVVLGSIGLCFWFYNSYEEAVEEEEGFQTQIALARVKRDKVPDLEREVIRLRENVEKYVKILPDTKEVNEFVRKVSDFVSQSGVILESLKDDNRQNRRKKKEVFDKEAFRIALKGNTFQLLRFLSLVENYERFIKITEVSIKGGVYDEDTMRQDVVHEVNLLVETFVYHGDAGHSGTTKIQNYEKKREMIKDIIDVDKGKIDIDRYEYVFDSSMRDPFIDPRSWATGEEMISGLEPIEQEKFIDNIMDKIYEIKGFLEIVKDSDNLPLIRRMELQKEVGKKILDLNDEINKSVEENWITDSALRLKMDREIMPEVNAINSFVQNIPAKEAIPIKELEYLRDKLAQKFEEEDYDGVLEQYKLVKPRLDELLTNVELGSDKNTLVNEIEELATRADVSKEFKAISINITGIICQPERSVVIVNSQVLTEGQRLQDDLIVHQIEEKAVHFQYKGVVFKVVP